MTQSTPQEGIGSGRALKEMEIRDPLTRASQAYTGLDAQREMQLCRKYWENPGLANHYAPHPKGEILGVSITFSCCFSGCFSSEIHRLQSWV